MGRPSYKITPEVCVEAEKLASQGLTKVQIALSLGMVYETLRQKARQYDAFSAAIERGEAEGIKQVTNALFNASVGGDVQAMRYYLNNRSPEWSEKQSIEIADARKHPTVQEVGDRVDDLLGRGTDGHSESPVTH